MRRLGEARVARMATADASGIPHVVPVVFTLDGQTVYWTVDRKPKRSGSLKRLENIRVNPSVELLADHYEEDWRALWWVRVAGRAHVLRGTEEGTHALRLLSEKYPQYRMDPPQGPAVAVEIDRWSAWEAS